MMVFSLEEVFPYQWDEEECFFLVARCASNFSTKKMRNKLTEYAVQCTLIQCTVQFIERYYSWRSWAANRTCRMDKTDSASSEISTIFTDILVKIEQNFRYAQYRWCRVWRKKTWFIILFSPIEKRVLIKLTTLVSLQNGKSFKNGIFISSIKRRSAIQTPFSKFFRPKLSSYENV